MHRHAAWPSLALTVNWHIAWTKAAPPNPHASICVSNGQRTRGMDFSSLRGYDWCILHCNMSMAYNYWNKWHPGQNQDCRHPVLIQPTSLDWLLLSRKLQYFSTVTTHLTCRRVCLHMESLLVTFHKVCKPHHKLIEAWPFVSKFLLSFNLFRNLWKLIALSTLAIYSTPWQVGTIGMGWPLADFQFTNVPFTSKLARQWEEQQMFSSRVTAFTSLILHVHSQTTVQTIRDQTLCGNGEQGAQTAV